MILDLKSYKNGTVYQVANLEDSANLYVASDDDPSNLRLIQIITGGNTYSLADLVSTPQKITISGGLTITSTNPDAVTYALTGYIYVTTAQQAQDPLFKVLVVTGAHTLNANGVQATTVILNTELEVRTDDADQPTKSSYVSNLKMTSNENLKFHWGIPAANWKQGTTNNTFFMNPYTDGTNTMFFDHTEPMQIGLDCWYIISSGPVSMGVKNDYVPNHNYTTTAANTTGLLVSGNFLYQEHQVNFLPDPTRSRTVGTFITAYIPQGANVNFTFVAADGSWVQTFDSSKNNSQLASSSPLAAQKLNVKSSRIFAGTFYCQYFGISTAMLPISSSSTTVTSPAIITTSQGGKASTTPSSAPPAPGSSSASPTGTSGSSVSPPASGPTTSMPAQASTTPSGTMGSTLQTTTKFSRSPSILISSFAIFYLII